MSSTKGRAGLFLLLWVSFPLTMFGQDFQYKGAVYGGLGYAKFYEDDGALGTGLTYRSGIEWRQSGRLGFEAELLGVRFTRSDAFNVRGNTQYGLVNVVFYFSRSAIQPYAKAGFGVYRTRYSYSWPSISEVRYQKARTGAAIDIGAGVRFFVNRRWSINPDFRIAAGTGYYGLLNHLTVSLGYHW